jgi:hypothetical protein
MKFQVSWDDYLPQTQRCSLEEFSLQQHRLDKRTNSELIIKKQGFLRQ